MDDHFDLSPCRKSQIEPHLGMVNSAPDRCPKLWRTPSVCSKRLTFQRMMFRPSVPLDSGSTWGRLWTGESGALSLVYHLSSLSVANGIVLSPSVNQPSSGKRTSMIIYGCWWSIATCWTKLDWVHKIWHCPSLLVCLSHHSLVSVDKKCGLLAAKDLLLSDLPTVDMYIYIYIHIYIYIQYV